MEVKDIFVYNNDYLDSTPLPGVSQHDHKKNEKEICYTDADFPLDMDYIITMKPNSLKVIKYFKTKAKKINDVYFNSI